MTLPPKLLIVDDGDRYAEMALQFSTLAVAVRLLIGSPARNARRVRLRFNQLGLRVRPGRRRSK